MKHFKITFKNNDYPEADQEEFTLIEAASDKEALAHFYECNSMYADVVVISTKEVEWDAE